MNQARPLTLADWATTSAQGFPAWEKAWQQARAAIPSYCRRPVIASEPGADALHRAWEQTHSRPLHAAPAAYKDLFDLAGLPTTASSTFLHELRPTPAEDCELARLATAAGLVPALKAHLHEFAYGLTGENPHYGNCPHPALPGHLSGGSSSGSVWLAARRICPITFGTDTGGSIRVPASYCGVFGYRHLPSALKGGCFPLSPTYDTAGWFTAEAGDMLTASRALLGPVETGEAPLPACLFIPEGFPHADAFRRFAARHGLTEDSQLAGTLSTLLPQGPQTFSVVQSTDACAVHQAWLDTHADRYDPAVLARIMRGRNWTAADYAAAETHTGQIKAFFQQVWQHYGCLALPAAPTAAPRPGDISDAFRRRILEYTAPASLAQLPALTIPIPLGPGQTHGLQIILPSPNSPWRETLLGLYKQNP